MTSDPTRPTRAGFDDDELEALTRSLREFGFVQPVLARREDNTVIGGHQRLLAARRLGLQDRAGHLPRPLASSRRALLNLALNKISGEWDEELLARLLADLSASPTSTSRSPASARTSSTKLLQVAGRPREARARRVVRPRRRAGGRTCGTTRPSRATSGRWATTGSCAATPPTPSDVARLLGGTTGAMALHRPALQRRPRRPRRPAARASAGGASRTTPCRPSEWEAFVPRLGAQPPRQRRRRALHLHEHEGVAARLARPRGGRRATGRDTIIWAKDRFVLGRADYQRQYEPIWFGWREGAKHYWCGDRDQGDVWTIDAAVATPTLHPTMKPLALDRAGDREQQPRRGVRPRPVPRLGQHADRLRAHRASLLRHGDRPRLRRRRRARWERFSGLTAEKADGSSRYPRRRGRRRDLPCLGILAQPGDVHAPVDRAHPTQSVLLAGLLREVLDRRVVRARCRSGPSRCSGGSWSWPWWPPSMRSRSSGVMPSIHHSDGDGCKAGPDPHDERIVSSAGSCAPAEVADGDPLRRAPARWPSVRRATDPGRALLPLALARARGRGRGGRRLGGLRRKRERTVAGAYELEGLASVPALRRLLEVVAVDTLSLDNGIARSRVLIALVAAAAKLIELGEIEERLSRLEAAAATAPQPPVFPLPDSARGGPPVRPSGDSTASRGASAEGRLLAWLAEAHQHGSLVDYAAWLVDRPPPRPPVRLHNQALRSARIRMRASPPTNTFAAEDQVLRDTALLFDLVLVMNGEAEQALREGGLRDRLLVWQMRATSAESHEPGRRADEARGLSMAKRWAEWRAGVVGLRSAFQTRGRRFPRVGGSLLRRTGRPVPRDRGALGEVVGRGRRYPSWRWCRSWRADRLMCLPRPTRSGQSRSGC